MTDGRDENTLQEALDRAKDAMLPADDPDALEPNYPADYTPEERVEHVLRGEFPRWRSIEWITAAADTDPEVCWSVIQERLSEGEVEISSEGVRRNRYHVYFEKVEKATEQARGNPRWLL